MAGFRRDAPSAPCVLSVRGLTLRRGQTQVLEDVSFSAQPGAITALLGEAASGKTSLLAATAGLLKPQRGGVFVGSKEVTALAGARRGIFFLPPGAALGLRGTAAAVLPARGHALSALDALCVPPGTRLAEASHGQALAALTAARLDGTDPVLLLDEAAAGLSHDAQARLMDWLRAQAAMGRTIVMATRDSALALEADHLVLLRAGGVLQAGAPASLHAEPRDEAAARLTGRVNILRGTLRQKLPGGFIWVEAGQRFTQADQPGQPTPGLGTPMALCLRPGQVTAGPPAGINRLDAVVERLVCRGDRTEILCRTALGPVYAAMPAPTALRPGMETTLGWAPDAGIILRSG